MNLYKFGIKENLLLTQEVVTPFMFNNIVSISILENEIVYLQDLVWQYRDLLPSDWRRDAVGWAELNIAFAQGKFLYIMEVIVQHQCVHWLYKLQYKIIRMMTLAELVIEGTYKIKSLETFVDSFTKYIQRNNKKYQFRIEPYEGFIKCTHELVKLSIPKGQNQIEKRKTLHERIINMTYVYRRDWLIEKLAIK